MKGRLVIGLDLVSHPSLQLPFQLGLSLVFSLSFRTCSLISLIGSFLLVHLHSLIGEIFSIDPGHSFAAGRNKIKVRRLGEWLHRTWHCCDSGFHTVTIIMQFSVSDQSGREN